MKGNKSVATTVVIIVVLLIIVGAVFALAGNKKKDTSGTQPMNMNNSQSSSSNSNSSSTPVSTDAVTIQSFAFTPQDITVKVGTTVTWTNQDSIGHTVTSDDGDSLSPKLNSNMLQKGDTYTYTFSTPGTYKYHCSVHPEMTGTVTVTQ